jgi:hypothetical protein
MYARTFGVKSCQPGHARAVAAIWLAPILPYFGLPLALSAGEHAGRFASSKSLSAIGVRLNQAFLIAHCTIFVAVAVILLIVQLQR